MKLVIEISEGLPRVPDTTAEDSTVEDSTAELYLTTTLRRSFSKNADSTAELEKMQTLRRSFSKKKHILLSVAPD